MTDVYKEMCRMKILFVNGSPNKNGNTAKIAGAEKSAYQSTIVRFCPLEDADFSHAGAMGA